MLGHRLLDKHTAIGAISILLWGSILPLVRLAVENRGMCASIMGIQGIAGLFGLTLFIRRGHLPFTRAPYQTVAFASRLTLYAVHIFAVYMAVSTISRPAMPAVIFCNYLWPSLVLLYSIPIARLHIPRPTLLRIGIATVVVALALEFGVKGFSQDFNAKIWSAVLLAILAANMWGIYSAITRRYGETSGGSGVVPLFQLVCACIAMLVNYLSAEPVSIIESLSSWPIILAGIFNFVAYLCWDIGIRKGNVVSLSLLADFIPWLSLATTSVVLGIAIEPITVVSAAILVIGALTARLGTLTRSAAGR